MKLNIAIDGQMYEVEVEVAEDDDHPQMQDNRPTPAATTIQSVVLRTPHKPGSSLDPDNHDGNRRHRAGGGKAEIGQRCAGRVGEGKPGAGRIRLTSCSRSDPGRLRATPIHLASVESKSL